MLPFNTEAIVSSFVLLPCYSDWALKCKSALVILLQDTDQIHCRTAALSHFGPTHWFGLITLPIFCSSHKEILLISHTVPSLKDFTYTAVLSSHPPCPGANTVIYPSSFTLNITFWRRCPFPEQTSQVSYECSCVSPLFFCSTNYIYLVFGFPIFKPLSCMRADIQYVLIGYIDACEFILFIIIGPRSLRINQDTKFKLIYFSAGLGCIRSQWVRLYKAADERW